jgi:hypothetical protein
MITLSVCTPIKARKLNGENLVSQREDRDPALTIFLFVCRLGINCVQWETRLSRNGKVSDSQCVHFLFTLAFGIALKTKRSKTNHTNLTGKRMIISKLHFFTLSS